MGNELGTNGWLSHLSATLHLGRISLGRLVRSRQTLVSVFLLALAALAAFAWSLRRERLPGEFVDQIFQAVFVTFLLPIYCLSYGTAGIASDREEQTLVYLFVTPLPRPLIFLAKSAASMALAAGWSLGGLLLLAALGGSAGRTAWDVLWPSVGWAAVAYTSLFLLFSVLFRRATIVALAYALFLETLIGRMPGIAQRLTVSFYARSLIHDATRTLEGISPPSPSWFLPLEGPDARAVLIGLSGGFLLLSVAIFTFREYGR